MRSSSKPPTTFTGTPAAETWSDIRKLGVTGKTDSLGGGHAHVGMLIYQGGLWPEKYHGAVLTCNLHGNRINMDTLHREGCGYVGKHAPDFMKAKDKWFRGIDLLTGPDGNVFVADWSDSGECHDNDGVHRSSGRIYKIVYGEPKKAEPINVAAMKDEELVKLLGERTTGGVVLSSNGPTKASQCNSRSSNFLLVLAGEVLANALTLIADNSGTNRAVLATLRKLSFPIQLR
jgi:hypothetical protein